VEQEKERRHVGRNFRQRAAVAAVSGRSSRDGGVVTLSNSVRIPINIIYCYRVGG